MLFTLFEHKLYLTFVLLECKDRFLVLSVRIAPKKKLCILSWALIEIRNDENEIFEKKKIMHENDLYISSEQIFVTKFISCKHLFVNSSFDHVQLTCPQSLKEDLLSVLIWIMYLSTYQKNFLSRISNRQRKREI